MKQNKITSLEYSTLIFFLLNSFIMNISITKITNITNTDSIFYILIGGLLTIIFTFFIFQIREKYPNGLLSIFKNKIIKYFFYLIIISIFLIVNIYSLTTIISFIHYFILKENSLFLITTTIVITVLYIVKQGIRTIAKTSEIFFLLYLIIYIIGIIGLLKYIDISNIKPLLTVPINIGIKSSLIYFLSTISPLFLLLIIPKNKMEINKSGKKLPYFFIILSTILIIIQTIIIISVLGIQLTNLYEYPDIIIYKKISFLNILERVEVYLAFNNILNSIYILIMRWYR